MACRTAIAGVIDLVLAGPVLDTEALATARASGNSRIDFAGSR